MILVVAMMFGMVNLANASILTFDELRGYNHDANISAIDQAYGDSITSTSVANDGAYIEGNGFTPNVNVAYNTFGGSLYLNAWHDGFGDLHNVAYADNATAIAEIKFIADPGYKVTINSLGAWTIGNLTASLLQIIDGDGVEVWGNYPCL